MIGESLRWEDGTHVGRMHATFAHASQYRREIAYEIVGSEPIEGDQEERGNWDTTRGEIGSTSMAVCTQWKNSWTDVVSMSLDYYQPDKSHQCLWHF